MKTKFRSCEIAFDPAGACSYTAFSRFTSISKKNIFAEKTRDDASHHKRYGKQMVEKINE